jgi:ATP-dependent DNA helicase PIF1
MRVLRGLASPRQQDFAAFLLEVGNGTALADGDGNINIPFGLHCESMADIISNVYNDLESHIGDLEYFASRAILAPTNTHVHSINRLVGNRFQTQRRSYLSADSIVDAAQARLFPDEFLHSLDVSGMPPHDLNLKVGYQVMLLRNIAPEKGLCNGTRLVITKLRPHVVEAQIAIGAFRGEAVFIPRIIMDSSKNLLPFQLRRRQVPLSPAFAITINKSQGQTLQRAIHACSGL